LNIFERYAEDASSETMRALWARVLAGEIRRPGQFSLRTLRFMSELDATTAKLFESYARAGERQIHVLFGASSLGTPLRHFRSIAGPVARRQPDDHVAVAFVVAAQSAQPLDDEGSSQI